ncbi:Mitochondrial ornithine transporter 1 [Smittium mucronatum]|uniref:Mitochondrial ornithine transporter 1 n=1 Tax=Smittium mucronatum TaxID=133383 RepID=A0A1R0H0U1_9FUNG|nr:Mitochondrial ornithine transporter 1 [Smittium mucronatum]
MQLSSLIQKEQLSKLSKLKIEIAKKSAYDIPKTKIDASSISNLKNQISKSEIDCGLKGNVRKSSNINSAIHIFECRGASGLFSGLRIHLVRDFLGTGIYFSTYEASKELFRKLSNSSNTGPVAHSLAGGFCGILSWLIIFPIDLVKSVYQKDLLTDSSSKKTYRQVFLQIKKEYGFKGFYRGISVTLFRAFPLHALNFTVYEYMKERISNYYKS